MYKIYYKLQDYLLTIKHAYQRAVRGYDDSAKWSLYFYIAELAVPVLKDMIENSVGYPEEVGSQKKWAAILKKMVIAFELSTTNKYLHTPKEIKQINDGLDLFRKYFLYLWD